MRVYDKEGKHSIIDMKPRELRGKFAYNKAIILTEDDLSCPGSKVQKIVVLPDTLIEPHYHETTRELFYVESGFGHILINGQSYVAEPGTMFFIEPGDDHGIKTESAELTLIIFKTNEGRDDIYYKDDTSSQAWSRSPPS